MHLLIAAERFLLDRLKVALFGKGREGTPWKINGWSLQIAHLERQMITSRELCSMLIFKSVSWKSTIFMIGDTSSNGCLSTAWIRFFGDVARFSFGIKMGVSLLFFAKYEKATKTVAFWVSWMCFFWCFFCGLYHTCS